jgi:hypothetical protein
MRMRPPTSGRNQGLFIPLVRNNLSKLKCLQYLEEVDYAPKEVRYDRQTKHAPLRLH